MPTVDRDLRLVLNVFLAVSPVLGLFMLMVFPLALTDYEPPSRIAAIIMPFIAIAVLMAASGLIGMPVFILVRRVLTPKPRNAANADRR